MIRLKLKKLRYSSCIKRRPCRCFYFISNIQVEELCHLSQLLGMVAQKEKIVVNNSETAATQLHAQSSRYF